MQHHRARPVPRRVDITLSLKGGAKSGHGVDRAVHHHPALP